MQDAIAGLEPAGLWAHFLAISGIPRCSGCEEKVRSHVVETARRHGFPCKLDAVGNLLVQVPAAQGMESAPCVIIQSHLDMVCEKNRDTVHDFSRDGLTLLRQDDWVKASGTTLGADNGVGVAAMLAVMEGQNLRHGPLELLFTVDEETGLTGAAGMGEELLEGRIMLNTDAEEEGAVYIGCAGGCATRACLPLELEKMSSDLTCVRVRLGGLQGGHSGVHIHEGRGNAIRLLTRFLWNVQEKLDLRLAHLDGGSKQNAIPRECDATVCLPEEALGELDRMIAAYGRTMAEEYRHIDPGLSMRMEPAPLPADGEVFTRAFQERVLALLKTLPEGVLAMSHTLPGLVETSSNVAVVQCGEGELSIVTSHRSSVESRLAEVSERAAAAGKLAGARLTVSDGYPGWTPDPDGRLLRLARQVRQDCFGEEPRVKAIHAGFECGIIGSKFPGMEMISIGPTIEGAHSPDEAVQIDTVQRFWAFLLGILEAIDRF